MSPGSFEVHTATTGPGNPETEPTSYLGPIAAWFEGPGLDPRGRLPERAARLDRGADADVPRQRVLEQRRVGPLEHDRRVARVNAVTFSTPGTYTFYCLIHPFMKGTVTVTQ